MSLGMCEIFAQHLVSFERNKASLDRRCRQPKEADCIRIDF